MGLRTKMTAKSTIFLFSSFLIVLVVLAGISVYRKYSKPSLKEVVASVGPIEITEEAVQYQMAVNQIRIPQETDRALALKQLKEVAAYEFIMQKYGWPIGPQELIQEAQRIEQGSRARKLLERIQAIQGFDPRFYMEVFVRGTLVRRLIFNEFYFSKQELHQSTFNRALNFAASVESQPAENILSQAQKEDLKVFDIRILPSEGFQSRPVEKSQPARALSNPVIEEPGQEQRKSAAVQWLQQHSEFQTIHRAYLFNEGERWGLFFPTEWKPQSMHVQGLLVVVPKIPFQNWLKSELSQIDKSPSGEALSQ